MRWRILSIAAWMVALSGAGVLALWAMGRAESDHWEWSQYLLWPPSPLMLMVSCLLLSAGTLLARLAGPADGATPKTRRPCSRTRGLAWLAWLGALAYMLVSECHVQRYLSPVRTPEGTPSMRVLFWNPASQNMESFAERVVAPGADIVVITNAPYRTDWGPVRASFGAPTFTARADRFSMVGRYPVLRWGFTNLRITGGKAHVAAWPGGGNTSSDTGQAMFFELDTTPVTDESTTVWVLDLPSDPDLSRWTVMREAAAAINGFTGPVYKRTDAGLDQAEPGPVEGFPTPDLVLGDFNTPRGSDSLGEVTGTMEHAFDQAGRGYAATWPRQVPILAIDQAFVGPRLRATGYRILDFGKGEHCAELVDLVRGGNR